MKSIGMFFAALCNSKGTQLIYNQQIIDSMLVDGTDVYVKNILNKFNDVKK